MHCLHMSHKKDARLIWVKWIYLSKALTCMKFFLFKQCIFFFIKETDTFGHIVV